MSRTERREIENLIAEYYLRDLSEDELKQLQQALELDDELQKLFVDAGRDEWLLHHVYEEEMEKIVPFKSSRSQMRRRIRAIAAGVAVLLSLGTLYLARNTEVMLSVMSAAPPVVASVSDFYVMEGDAISVVNEGRVRKLNDRSRLRNGDRILVPIGARLSFQYAEEETFVTLAGGTSFAIHNDNGAKHIRLTYGGLGADVAKQPQGRPMRVRTDDAEAVVLGTSFEIFAGGVTRLMVSSGTVRLKSADNLKSIDVSAGSFADSSDTDGWKALSYYTTRHLPDVDRTVNYQSGHKYILVDPERNSLGLLQFNLGKIRGKILEATLRLRVMNHLDDFGGSGNVRLFRVDPSEPQRRKRVEISNYDGQVYGGMDLVFDIEPTMLGDRINAFLIALDEGGNDFWFSSSEGEIAPELTLKMVEEK